MNYNILANSAIMKFSNDIHQCETLEELECFKEAAESTSFVFSKELEAIENYLQGGITLQYTKDQIIEGVAESAGILNHIFTGMTNQAVEDVSDIDAGAIECVTTIINRQKALIADKFNEFGTSTQFDVYEPASEAVEPQNGVVARALEDFSAVLRESDDINDIRHLKIILESAVVEYNDAIEEVQSAIEDHQDQYISTDELLTTVMENANIINNLYIDNMNTPVPNSDPGDIDTEVLESLGEYFETSHGLVAEYLVELGEPEEIACEAFAFNKQASAFMATPEVKEVDKLLKEAKRFRKNDPHKALDIVNQAKTRYNDILAELLNKVEMKSASRISGQVLPVTTFEITMHQVTDHPLGGAIDKLKKKIVKCDTMAMQIRTKAGIKAAESPTEL